MTAINRPVSSVTIINPLADRERAFLRMLRDTAGGRMQLIRLHDRQCAEACQTAGYCTIKDEGRCKIVAITPRGHSYLHKMMGAH